MGFTHATSGVNLINELGLYRLVFQSHKLEAEAFKIWVFNIIKELRKSLGLSQYEAFRLLDKEHQKEAMRRLNESLHEPTKVDYIKANVITDKAISNKHGYPKNVATYNSGIVGMVKKSSICRVMPKSRAASVKVNAWGWRFR
jgi:prophage antirepressor-like protein